MAACMLAVLISNADRFVTLRHLVSTIGDLALPDHFATKTIRITVAPGQEREVVVDKETFDQFLQLRAVGGEQLNAFVTTLLNRKESPEARARIRDLDAYKNFHQAFPVTVLELESWRQRLLTALAVMAVGVWFSAILTDRRFRALLIAIAFLGIWCLLSLASALDSFWLSASFVFSLTLIGAAFILHDMEKGTGASKNRMVLFTASLFLASGLFTLAGWFYPLPYAQPLKNSGLVAGFIDLRLAASMLFAASFLATGVISAVVNVWGDESAWLRVKRPIPVLERCGVKEGFLNELLNHVLAPVILIIQGLVQAQRSVAEVSNHLVRMVWELFKKQLYASFLRLLKFVAGCWLVAAGCYWCGPHLRNYLNDTHAFWDSTTAWQNATIVLAFISVCLLGLHVLTYKKHSHFTQRDVAGKLLPVLFAAFLTGLGAWLLQALGLADGIGGFRQPGLYTVAFGAITLAGAAASVLQASRKPSQRPHQRTAVILAAR
jgi:hypothetical protein